MNEELKIAKVKANIGNILKDLNQLPITKDYMKELGKDCDFRKIPIAPSMIQGSTTPVVLSDEVTDAYHTVLEYLNRIAFAAEFPFVVLGNRKSIEGQDAIILEKIIFCCDPSSTLSSRRIGVDGQELLNAISNPSYNVVAWGRTHGVSNRKQDISRLSQEYKDKYNVREPALNISVGDLDEYLGITTMMNGEDYGKEIFEMIIMHNGEIAMIGTENNQYRKFEDIQMRVGEEELEQVPVSSFDPKFSKGMNKHK